MLVTRDGAVLLAEEWRERFAGVQMSGPDWLRALGLGAAEALFDLADALEDGAEPNEQAILTVVMEAPTVAQVVAQADDPNEAVPLVAAVRAMVDAALEAPVPPESDSEDPAAAVGWITVREGLVLLAGQQPGELRVVAGQAGAWEADVGTVRYLDAEQGWVVDAELPSYGDEQAILRALRERGL